MARRTTRMHHAGPSLRPGPRFRFVRGSSRVPMTQPRRSRQHYGRRGGIRY